MPNEPAGSYESEEEEIDVKEVLGTLFRYRYMIFFLMVLATILSGVYVYFKSNTYKATATIEIGSKKSSLGGQDLLAMAMDQGASEIDTEKEIIRSRFIATKAFHHVNMTHHYYATVLYKTRELYNASPFTVDLTQGFGIRFTLIPLDDDRFRLSVNDQKDTDGNLWVYDTIHRFDKEIHTKHFHLTVHQKKPLEKAEYAFKINTLDDTAIETQKHTSVSQASKRSTILIVSVEDNIAKRAQEFTNALASAYLQQSIEQRTKEAEKKLAFIDTQLTNITKSLKVSAIKLEQFKEHSSTIELSTKAESIIRQMSEQEVKLSEVTIQEKMLNRLRHSIKAGKPLETISVVGLSRGDTSLSGMIQKLQDALLQRKELREEYTNAYPGIKKLNRSIATLKHLIATSVTNLAKSVTEHKHLLDQSLQKLKKRLNILPKDERKLGELHRTFLVNEKIYSYLLEKRSETAILKAAAVSKNRIIDPALLPKNPIKPKRSLIILVGMLLGLILGIALAFLRNFLDDTIKNREEIEQHTSVPVLGTIPHIKDGNDSLAVFLSPKSAVAESFRNLRTNLQFMSNTDTTQIITVTSTIGGEGKTTVSTNLAGILSMIEKRVVIINLDMRKPTLHKIFNLSNAQGMSTLLSGHTTLEKVIQATQYPHLDMISSGPVPPNPSELIQNTHMEEVLTELKSRYDVIILDTPPVGLVTDARVLMHFSDTTIYVTRANYSKKAFLTDLEKLSKEDIKNMGVLLNDLQANEHKYGGYGYGYYEEG